MQPVAVLEDLQMLPGASPITWSLCAGQAWAIMGPSQGGKSLLLETLAKRRRPARGSVRTRGEVAWAELPADGRRWTPQSVAVHLAGRSRAAESSEALSRLGLWELRRHHVTSLPESLRSAVAILPAILSSADLILVDGVLDHLDPWRSQAAWDMIVERRRERTVLVCTHSCELASQIERIAVLRQRELVYRGSVLDLLCQTRPQRLVVETNDQTTVRALVAPLALHVEEVENGLRLTLPPGQREIVDLLLHGYGSVHAIQVQLPRLSEALLALCSP